MVYLTGKANAAGLVPISQFRRCKISAMSIYIYTHMIHLQLWSSSWGSRHQTVSFCISKLISQKCQYASEAQIKTALLPINENCELSKNRAERRESGQKQKVQWCYPIRFSHKFANAQLSRLGGNPMELPAADPVERMMCQQRRQLVTRPVAKWPSVQLERHNGL